MRLELQPFNRVGDVVDGAQTEDFVYLDPPYAPVSRTAKFTSYTSGGFTQGDQRRLRDIMMALAARGCSLVLSNSTAPVIVDLYERDRDVAAAGLQCHTVPARGLTRV